MFNAVRGKRKVRSMAIDRMEDVHSQRSDGSVCQDYCASLSAHAHSLTELSKS